MKFLLINYEYPPIGAGAAHATFHLASELVALEHQVTVVTAAFGVHRGWSTEEGVEVFRCPSRRKSATQSSLVEMASFLMSARFRLPGILRRIGKPDGAIIFFSLPCGILGFYLKGRHFIPYCISLRGGDVPGAERELGWLYGLTRRIRRRVLSGSRAVVANSLGLGDLARKVDSIEVQVIPNGVDSEFFAPDSNDSSQSGEVIRFVFVGRFQPQKNLFYVLDRFAELCAATETSFEIVFVGDGPERQALKSHSHKLGLDGVFRMEPWCGQEDLRRHYLDADCLVNLSLYEGMPNAVLEAMACGLPVIVSDVAGHEMLVENGINGFMVSLSEPNNVVSRFLETLQDRELRKTMGARSRSKAMTEFSWRRMAESYAQLFENR